MPTAEQLQKAESQPLVLEKEIPVSAARPPGARGDAAWESARQTRCESLRALLTDASASQKACDNVRLADDGSAFVGSDTLIPYCGRVGAMIIGQKMGVARGSDMASNLTTCAEAAWEAACDSGVSGQYNNDPLDIGYGNRAFAPDPMRCYCAAFKACAEGPVMSMLEQKPVESRPTAGT